MSVEDEVAYRMEWLLDSNYPPTHATVLISDEAHLSVYIDAHAFCGARAIVLPCLAGTPLTTVYVLVTLSSGQHKFLIEKKVLTPLEPPEVA